MSALRNIARSPFSIHCPDSTVVSVPGVDSGVRTANPALLRIVLLAGLTAVGAFAFPVPASAQRLDSGIPVVTLGEARRRAAMVDPDAVAARALVEISESERRAARTDLLTPSVSASTNYTRFSDPFFNFGTGDITANATSATLQGSYTLPGVTKLAAVKRSRAALESAEASETAERFRTALATDEAYFAVLAARELSRVAADRLARAQEQFGIARVRVVAGDVIATDSLQLLLEVTRARLDVLRRDSALVVSRLRLGRQIGLAGPADAASIDTTPPRPLPMTEEAAVTELRARGPELEAVRAEERRADADLGAERGRYFPDITIAATTGAYDAQFFPSALKRSQLAVALTLPIWNGGERELGVARARALRTVARSEREERERAAAEVIAEAYLGYETSRARIELAQVGVIVATESYRVQRARYREGATPILDLLEAQGALSDAEAELVQARYATRLALAQIEALLGRRLFGTEDTSSTNRDESR